MTASDKTVRVWFPETGTVLTEPMQHNGGVKSARFSPDGKRIVTASDDKTARVWDAKTGTALTEPMQHEGGVRSAQFSPDGKRIVTTSDKTVRIWDSQTGKPLTEVLEHGEVRSAQFSPDGMRVLTASHETARVWDISPVGNAAPNWLTELAEAVAGQHLNENGVFEPLNGDPSKVMQQLRDRLNGEAADDDWVRWGKWFLADRSTRTISPFSKVRLTDQSRAER